LKAWGIGLALFQAGESRRTIMAKGQMRSNKETRKPKSDKVKTASGSTSDPVKGLANPIKLPNKK
jgi:hypothetical protein